MPQETTGKMSDSDLLRSEWSEIRVIVTVTACDPGRECTTAYSGRRQRPDIVLGEDLLDCIENSEWRGFLAPRFKPVTFVRVEADGAVISYDGREIKVTTGGFANLGRVGLDYAYADLGLTVRFAYCNIIPARFDINSYEEYVVVKALADGGYTDAENRMGYIHFYGCNRAGIPVDLNLANRWWNKAAWKNHPLATTCLGISYMYGDGVAVDTKRAMSLIKRGADLGCANAFYSLGVSNISEDATTGDYHEARQLFQIAYDAGYRKALSLITMIDYYNASDYDEYAELLPVLHEEASADDELSSKILSECYENGYGCDVNLEESLKWLRKSAELGYVTAQEALAQKYIENEYFPENDDKDAVYWLAKAAQQNSQYAMWMLSILYASAGNEKKAYEHLLYASSLGHAVASELLARKEFPAFTHEYPLTFDDGSVFYGRVDVSGDLTGPVGYGRLVTYEGDEFTGDFLLDVDCAYRAEGTYKVADGGEFKKCRLDRNFKLCGVLKQTFSSGEVRLCRYDSGVKCGAEVVYNTNNPEKFECFCYSDDGVKIAGFENMESWKYDDENGVPVLTLTLCDGVEWRFEGNCHIYDNAGESYFRTTVKYPDGRCFSTHGASLTGVGMMIYADGSSLCDEWDNGVPKHPENTVPQDGTEFECGIMPTGERCAGTARIAYNRIEYPDGSVYKGDIVENRPHGEGVFITADGRTFYAVFNNGLIDGEGECRVQMEGERNVKRIHGIWNGDTLQKEGYELYNDYNIPEDSSDSEWEQEIEED